DVNDLLFLWMLRIDESLAAGPATSDHAPGLPRGEAADRAVAICKHALAFVQPKEPWRALQARLERHRNPAADATGPHPTPGEESFAGEPHPVAAETSAHAAFQWALLSLRAKRIDRAIEWMRRAVRLEQDNYWYQYVLAYIEDQAGFHDDALNDYSVA